MKFTDVPEIVYFDTEFTERPGEIPELICVVGYNTKSQQWFEYWADETPPETPFSKDALLIGYAMASDITCIESRGWRAKHFIDLHAEYRLHTNEIGNKVNTSLLSALDHFRIAHITTEEKDRVRQICIRGKPFSAAERQIILPYCKTDVVSLPSFAANLLGPMNDQQFAQALIRGRFVWSVSRIETAAIPVDVPTLRDLESKWDNLLLSLIAEVDRDYNIYENTTFKFDRFAGYLARQGIAWPKTPKGRLKTDDDTLRSMAVAYPILNPLRELRATLSTMKHWSLAVGSDARNRTPLKPFGTQTGRNAPSNTASIFGPAVWLRGLMKPPERKVFLYGDYEQEEYFVSAILSGDENMKAAYAQGDVYLGFARQAHAVPSWATKETHRQIRDQFKQCVLAVGYGQQAHGLSLRLGCTEAKAQSLLDQHRKVYQKFWQWSDRVVATMQLQNEISTRAGWRIGKTGKLNAHQERSARNFLVQSTASNVLHVVSPMAIEAGLEVIMLVHDALLVLTPVDKVEEHSKTLQAVMTEASRRVLGAPLRVEIKVFNDRYMDERGESTWNLVMRLLRECPPPQQQYQLFGHENTEPRVTTTMSTSADAEGDNSYDQLEETEVDTAMTHLNDTSYGLPVTVSLKSL
jgi:hypothetical protein